MTTRILTLSLLAAAALTACGSAVEPPTPVPSAASTTGPTATGRPVGEPAVWALGPGQAPQGSSATFTVLVTRLDCNGGITGTVLPPQIRASGAEIVVTFSVVPKQSDLAPCPGNDQVPYTVDLGEPLRARPLVDGHCLPGQPGATTSFCTPDGIRFKP